MTKWRKLHNNEIEEIGRTIRHIQDGKMHGELMILGRIENGVAICIVFGEPSEPIAIKEYPYEEIAVCIDNALWDKIRLEEGIF